MKQLNTQFVVVPQFDEKDVAVDNKKLRRRCATKICKQRNATATSADLEVKGRINKQQFKIKLL